MKSKFIEKSKHFDSDHNLLTVEVWNNVRKQKDNHTKLDKYIFGGYKTSAFMFKFNKNLERFVKKTYSH